MNATRTQINGRNAIALVLAVVIVALAAALLAAIPELAVARPNLASGKIAAQAAPLAENPELMVSRRYTAGSQIAAEAALLSKNPELMASRRYAATSEIAVEAALLAENPELIIARHYVPPGGWTRRMPQHLKLHNKVDPNTDIGLLEFSQPQTIQSVTTADQLSSLLASNPELSVARRFAARGVIASEAAFLAANPELMASRRYAAVAAGRTQPLLGGR